MHKYSEKVMPELEKATLEAIQEIFDAIMFKTSLPQNALKLLRIQRLLINRQPKIFSPTRILLKEDACTRLIIEKIKPKTWHSYYLMISC
ncbi:hypothetical protein CEXT_158491 [Caerostris extrusa]|uniref:Uncharacterized protein n=1 Tax=Caerostris extrusa TaxID=172846 RepID=A0AAV4WZK7_CAEEX|nr:hypothetical protein CEXT_158491 [Caerostris extrusa]